MMTVNFEKDIEKSLQVLREGGLILYPTDTVWGIGCDATNAQAVERIYRLKERSESKSMIVLLADERDIVRYVANPDPEIYSYLDSVDRPTTIIYDGAIGLAPNLVAADGSIAIRLIAEDFCRHLIRRLRRPLVSTSANKSGRPTPTHYGGIEPEIVGGVDYVVQFRQNDNKSALPSRVIRWVGRGKFETIRS